MSAQDRETLAAAQARATLESAPAADSGLSGVGSIAETAVHPPANNHMEVDDLERELSGAF
jgi:mitogen-activated protein kinase 7